MKRFNTMRAAAIVAVCGALGLAGCGGGGGQTMLPSAALAGPNGGSGGSTQAKGNTATATLSIKGLAPTTSPQNTSRTTALSSSRSTAGTRNPQYLDQTSPNSAIVITVQPQDPAEAAQYGSLNVCYNLYTNTTLNAAIAAGSPPVVSVAFPAPPGTDGFQVTQYVGQCTSTYTVPTPPAGTANGGVLSQTPLVYASITAGAPATTNNINTLVGACTQPVTPPAPGSGFTCVGPGSGVTTIVSTIAVAGIAFGTLPISSPVRETGAFQLANGEIGVPIPLEGLNAGGTVVPGLTTIANPTGGAGPFPSGVTVTSNDTTGHTKLYLVDAANGAVAQAATTNAAGLTIHEFNALSGAVATGGNDITFPGSTAVAGDPWVIVLTFDGTGAFGTTPLSSVVVTATATIPPATTATTVTTTITPQSAVYTAVAAPNAGNTGYTDTAAPVKPVGLLQQGASVYFTDGASVKIDGTATVSPGVTSSTPAAAPTALTGLTYATLGATPYVYAVDNGQAGSSTQSSEIASGLYAFNPTTLAITPVAAQAGTGNWIQFNHPVAVVQGLGYVSAGSTKNFLFVEDSTGAVYKIDIQNSGAVDANGFQTASNVAPPILASGSLNPGTSTYVGVATTSSGTMLIGDPGNSRIALVNATTQTPTVSAAVSGAPFTGFTLTGTAGALYATSTSGQIYYVSPTGGVTSLGFTTGSSTDGPIGQLSSLTAPAALTPLNYPLQYQAGSFFSTTATPTKAGYGVPYTVAPFAAAGPVFPAVPPAGIGLAADTSAGATTGKGTINATAGILVFSPSAAATAVVTPGSFLFTDGGTKLRTIVQ